MTKSDYDQIASEYYDKRHITSRNFDKATKHALATRRGIHPDGLVLELGAGRGRTTEFLSVPSSRIVQLDNSEVMLGLSHREPCLLKLRADARKIPLTSQQFSAVTGFLVDPFFDLDCLAEAYRMLRDGGNLLFTMPTRIWGAPLRKRLGIDVMTTRFKILDRGDTIFLPSLLHPEEDINEMLYLTGFRSIHIHSQTLPERETVISPDITSVCDELKIDLLELPIIHVITAVR